jgi:hypothetical protein
MLTGVFGDYSLETIQKSILACSGTLIEENCLLVPPNSFLIASEPKRTKKFLLALAFNMPRISYQWVLDCFDKVRNYFYL